MVYNTKNINGVLEMKKYLLPETGNFYKANLHCHSTVSDGELTVEEIKKIYTEQGYSIVAYTDHEVLISQRSSYR